eukprot:scaffold53432_cov62-Phaeocystis_antarctica.AAC.2
MEAITRRHVRRALALDEQARLVLPRELAAVGAGRAHLVPMAQALGDALARDRREFPQGGAHCRKAVARLHHVRRCRREAARREELLAAVRTAPAHLARAVAVAHVAIAVLSAPAAADDALVCWRLDACCAEHGIVTAERAKNAPAHRLHHRADSTAAVTGGGLTLREQGSYALAAASAVAGDVWAG